MAKTVTIRNKRPNMLDLTMLKDIAGKPMMFQPAGSEGDTRIASIEALEHPHIQIFLAAQPPWIEVISELPKPKPIRLKSVEGTVIKASEQVAMKEAVTITTETSTTSENSTETKPAKTLRKRRVPTE